MPLAWARNKADQTRERQLFLNKEEVTCFIKGCKEFKCVQGKTGQRKKGPHIVKETEQHWQLKNQTASESPPRWKQVEVGRVWEGGMGEKKEEYRMWSYFYPSIGFWLQLLSFPPWPLMHLIAH